MTGRTHGVFVAEVKVAGGNGFSLPTATAKAGREVRNDMRAPDIYPDQFHALQREGVSPICLSHVAGQ